MTSTRSDGRSDTRGGGGAGRGRYREGGGSDVRRRFSGKFSRPWGRRPAAWGPVVFWSDRCVIGGHVWGATVACDVRTCTATEGRIRRPLTVGARTTPAAGGLARDSLFFSDPLAFSIAVRNPDC